MARTGAGADLYSRDQTFLQVLENHGVFLAPSEQASTVRLGHSISDYMSHGHTVDEATQILIDNGFSSYDATVIVTAAIGSYLSS